MNAKIISENSLNYLCTQRSLSHVILLMLQNPKPFENLEIQKLSDKENFNLVKDSENSKDRREK